MPDERGSDIENRFNRCVGEYLLWMANSIKLTLIEQNHLLSVLQG